jgi:hypothetical protein
VSNRGGARWVGGGAVLGSSGGTAALGHRGKLREAVAAEGKRERAAAAKKGGAVLGVRVVHATAPAPPADALRLDPIQARACF